MADQRDELELELEKIEVPSAQLSAFAELAYTAHETGLIDFKFHGDGVEEVLVKLVLLAGTFKGKVPENLRM